METVVIAFSSRRIVHADPAPLAWRRAGEGDQAMACGVSVARRALASASDFLSSAMQRRISAVVALPQAHRRESLVISLVSFLVMLSPWPCGRLTVLHSTPIRENVKPPRMSGA